MSILRINPGNDNYENTGIVILYFLFRPDPNKKTSYKTAAGEA